jgi:hypothetical protein
MSALVNLEQGNIEGAILDIETSLKNLFTNDIVPALKTFISQFASEFGSQLLADAATAAPGILAGTTSIETAAASLLSQAGVQATSDATTLALNALRVQVTAAAPPANAAPAAAS